MAYYALGVGAWGRVGVSRVVRRVVLVRPAGWLRDAVGGVAGWWVSRVFVRCDVGVGQDGVVMSHRRVWAWVGVVLALAGGGLALVAWVGLDKANAYLGIPAAIAALVGAGLVVFPLTQNGDEGGGDAPGAKTDQRAKATDGGQVLQVGGNLTTGPTAARIPTAPPGRGNRKQRAKAEGKSSRVEQVGGDWIDGGRNAGQT